MNIVLDPGGINSSITKDWLNASEGMKLTACGPSTFQPTKQTATDEGAVFGSHTGEAVAIVKEWEL